MTGMATSDRDTERRAIRGYRGKRAFDFSIAALLALPALAVCLVCALVIWLECRANPFFVQTRVGYLARPFRLVKLRTMTPDTGDRPTHHTGSASLLRSGALFRSTKIDELPQLWNVLRGEMSMVGPRPCLPSQTELIEARQAANVFQLRPGITGPSQLAGIDMSTPIELAQEDARYLDRASFAEDVRLILLTFVGRGSGDRIQR